MIKKFIGLLLISFGCTVTMQAQDPRVPVAVSQEPKNKGEVHPRAPYDWNKYISGKLKYPKFARRNGIQGKVFVSFVVERDGSLSKVKSTGALLVGGLSEEAERVVKSMPRWLCGTQNGVPVRSYYTIPVTFSLKNVPPIYNEKNVETVPAPSFNLPAFVAKNVQYPADALTQKLTPTVYIACIVTEKGKIICPTVFRTKAEDPALKELEDEAIRLVKAMPSWMPAKIEGIPVKCYTLIDIKFVLPLSAN